MSTQLRQMKWILFWVFLVLFILMVLGTLAMVFFGFGAPTESERALMVKGLIGEVAASIVALFYSIFGLNKSPEDLNEIQNEKIQEMSASIEELNRKISLLETKPVSPTLSLPANLEKSGAIKYTSGLETVFEKFEVPPPFSIEEFKLNPVAKEIHKDLLNTKPFDLKHRESSYIGRKVQWKAAFKSIGLKENGLYKVVADLDFVYMLIFEIDEATSHHFRNLDAGIPFWVCGEIIDIDPLFIRIKNARIETGK